MYGMKSGAKQLLVIGVDEVGRGPIAGPVAVGAFVILNPDEVKRLRIFRGVKESKQLSAAKREEWFGKILEAQEKGLVDYAVTFQSEKVIDKKGISFAIRTALAGSLGKLRDGDGKRRMPIDPGRALVLLDGGLKAPAEYVHQKTIIRGDAKETAIALASICAKVLRDRRMIQLAKIHSGYGFEIHKGYGTKRHYAALKTHGFSVIHRLTFCTKVIL